MDKYYTPKIEEFHVGFEYEIWETHSKLYNKDIDDSKWVLKTYGLNSIRFTKLYYEISNVRVKYLDKEDIESLGFEPDYVRTWGTRMCFKNSKCALTYISNIQELIISFEADVLLREDIRFKGTIKNKSELKRLMKQLSID
jgi:hypothetical protein